MFPKGPSLQYFYTIVPQGGGKGGDFNNLSVRINLRRTRSVLNPQCSGYLHQTLHLRVDGDSSRKRHREIYDLRGLGVGTDRTRYTRERVLESVVSVECEEKIRSKL